MDSELFRVDVSKYVPEDAHLPHSISPAEPATATSRTPPRLLFQGHLLLDSSTNPYLNIVSLLGAALLLDPGYSLLGILQLVRLNGQKLVKVIIACFLYNGTGPTHHADVTVQM